MKAMTETNLKFLTTATIKDMDEAISLIASSEESLVDLLVQGIIQVQERPEGLIISICVDNDFIKSTLGEK